MFKKPSTIALTTLVGLSSADAMPSSAPQPSEDVLSKRMELSARLDALAAQDSQFSAPIKGERLAQWNNWNNLWNNINWLNWKNF